MTDYKSWLQSSTIWGALAAAAGFITVLVKVDVAALMNDTLELAAAATTVVGIVTSIIGRFKAKTKLR